MYIVANTTDIRLCLAKDDTMFFFFVDITFELLIEIHYFVLPEALNISVGYNCVTLCASAGISLFGMHLHCIML